MTYKPVDSSPNFSQIEEKIQKRWQETNAFKQSIKGEKNFIFYDGPPFANGLPHYGHLLTGYVKDTVARFRTMQGFKVERRFGWDCHGLPAEMGAEKELGISGHKAIEEFGIQKFNDHCRQSVMRYTHEWQRYVTRQGRWVDFENDYKTMDLGFMESVIWAFKQLYDKGLIYRSYRVMPYSWACETPVSDFETRIDNAYRQKESKALTLKFPLISDKKGLVTKYNNLSLLVWTTTPWTLPSNLAAAVGAKIEYAVLKSKDEHLILAKDLVPAFENLLGAEIVEIVLGRDLIGAKYTPPFDDFASHPNSFVVLPAEFVETESGTGVVHIAPGFGEDDQKLCDLHQIELVCPVDSAGKFTNEITDYEGKQVFEANDDIIRRLKEKGLAIKVEQYLHNYPHCWRTDTPLIYKAVPSWYLKVTAIKEQMIQNNQQITWIPEHIKDGLFGKWLENARDWSISRDRFWGCPIPIWESDDPEHPHIEVFGSIAEIEAAFGVEVTDLHRPFIDTLTKANPKDPSGKSKMHRVKGVLDCWFESGSMPYAQLHYPFENKEKFEHNFPADFIVEYVAQTRGWFYTLLVLSTALFNKPPFKACICHGVILGDGGMKLSKRLQNYADPESVFALYGSDALRWYLISSPVMRGQEITIDKEATGVQEALRLIIKPLWNAYNFFVLYANLDKVRAEEDFSSENILDRYILSKLAIVAKEIKSSMDIYDIPNACASVEELLDVLNNWYIRRSRERFWRSGKDKDKAWAYNTLYTVLSIICKTVAPLLPHVTEEIFINLHPGAESVHLELFLEIGFKEDLKLVSDMERIKEACTAALSIRHDNKIRVRQPLSKVTFIGIASDSFNKELTQLVLDEINVKSWDNIDSSKIEQYANYKLKIHFPVVGKRIPMQVKDIIAANKASKWSIKDGQVEVGGVKLLSEEYELLLEAKPEHAGKIKALPSNDGMVLLDLEITKELQEEGYARDFVRIVQNMRKEANFSISDCINISFATDSLELQDAISSWGEYIQAQTLASNLIRVEEDDISDGHMHEIEGVSVTIGVVLIN